MERRTLLTLQLGGFALLLMFAPRAAPAQVEATVREAETGPALTTLATPEYPPLARMARITGEVKVEIAIGKDGKIQEVDATGHPLLKRSALASVQKSTFDCRGCSEVGTLVLTYSFEMSDDSDCCSGSPRPFEVTHSQNRIVITAPPTCCCDPSPDVEKVRSLKCLDLWKCGVVS